MARRDACHAWRTLARETVRGMTAKKPKHLPRCASAISGFRVKILPTRTHKVTRTRFAGCELLIREDSDETAAHTHENTTRITHGGLALSCPPIAAEQPRGQPPHRQRGELLSKRRTASDERNRQPHTRTNSTQKTNKHNHKTESPNARPCRNGALVSHE